MNLDFKVPNSPAVARKILKINRLLKLNLDERVAQQALEGMIQLCDLMERLPESILRNLSDPHLDLLQHSCDYNHRFIFGTHSFKDAAFTSLTCAQYAGNKSMVLRSSATPEQDDGEWKAMFEHLGLTFQIVTQPDATIDLSVDVLVIDHSVVQHAVLQETRGRTLISISDVENPRAAQPYKSSVFWDSRANPIFTIDDDIPLPSLAREFTQTIFAFYTKSPDDKNVAWWGTNQVLKMLTALHPDIKITDIMLPTKTTQTAIMGMGFSRLSPKHMAEIFGVNTQLLDSQ